RDGGRRELDISGADSTPAQGRLADRGARRVRVRVPGRCGHPRRSRARLRRPGPRASHCRRLPTVDCPFRIRRLLADGVTTGVGPDAKVPFQGNDRLLCGIILGVLTFWLFAQTTLNIAPDMSA